MRSPIEGKVARVVNAREVVINRGSADGVRLGARFAILDPAGEGVMDPDTGEVLGSLKKTKIEVEITQISDRIAVARTFRFRNVNEGGTGNALIGGEIARMFAPPRYVKHYETLRMTDPDTEPLSDEESLVRVGDPVYELVKQLDEDAQGPSTAGIIGPSSQAALDAPRMDED